MIVVVVFVVVVFVVIVVANIVEVIVSVDSDAVVFVCLSVCLTTGNAVILFIFSLSPFSHLILFSR